MKYILNFLSGIEFKDENTYIRLGSFLICNNKYLIINFPEDYPKKDSSEEQKYFVYETNQRNIETEAFKKVFAEKIKLLFNTLLYCVGKRAYTMPDTDFCNAYNNNKKLYHSSEEFGLEFRGNFHKTHCPDCYISDKLFKKKGNCLKLFDYIEKKPSSEIEQKYFYLLNGLAKD